MFGQIDDIEIRFISKEDRDPIYKAMDENREFLGNYIDFVNTITPEELEKHLVNWEAMQVLGRGFQVGLFQGEEALGQCSVTINTYDNRGEIGYWLVESATGRGIITRAVKEIMKFCFNFYGLHKLTIECMPENAKSRAVAERLGFVYEGRLRDHQKLKGDYCDLLVYSKLRDEWRLD